MNNVAGIPAHEASEWKTPAAPSAMATAFPELAPLAQYTTRLHPRQGQPAATESSMGGPLLWPETEPWPTCSGPHFGTIDAHAVPAAAVLQLFVGGVTDL